VTMQPAYVSLWLRTDIHVSEGEGADVCIPRPVPLRVTQAVSTVGTEPAGTQRYSLDENPLTYAGFPHTYGPPKMTENHGVPGSNPGPATYKSPANGGKI
jgi:hypothetical protein